MGDHEVRADLAVAIEAVFPVERVHDAVGRTAQRLVELHPLLGALDDDEENAHRAQGFTSSARVTFSVFFFSQMVSLQITKVASAVIEPLPASVDLSATLKLRDSALGSAASAWPRASLAGFTRSPVSVIFSGASALTWKPLAGLIASAKVPSLPALSSLVLPLVSRL